MSQQGAAKEYVVRAPKCARKKYNMMRFHTALGIDFKTWGATKMERENNLREYKNADDELPKFGAGSEFGREEREEARRKRYGINVKKYKADDQPWLLSVDGKSGKKFKGIREGGVSDNVSYYVFMQAKDGAFEAYPVEEWYNFQLINRYKALSAEEAEKEFERRDKIMNYFSVMYQKKLKKDDDADEEGSKKTSTTKSLMLSEMDDWMSDGDSNDEDKDSDDDDAPKKKGKKKGKGKNKRNQGGKRKKRDDGGTDDEVDEESDDFNEGAEHDYISEDSSDSEQENDEVARKQLAGVDEGEALKKLLDSESESEEDKDKEKKDEENEDEKNEEKDDKEKKKKKKKKKEKKEKKGQDSDGHSSDSSDTEGKKKKDENDPKKNTVNALKRKIKESPLEMNAAKKARHSMPGNSNAASTSAASGSETGVSEDLIKRYLMRKPMTTTELLQKCRSKKTGLSSEQLVTAIAQTLKRIPLVKQMVKGKMYLSVKGT